MRSLDAICETFAPGAVEQGVPVAVLDAIDHDLTARERQRLLLLLRTWLPGYSRLSQPRREAVLRLWRDSPVPLLRTGFQALRKAALAFAYLLPGRWEEIGYPGPPGVRADAPAPGSSRSRSATGSSSTATSASSAPAPAAASRPRCSPRPASTSSCSRRAATGRSATSTARSAPASGGSTAAAARPRRRPGLGADRRRVPRRRHRCQLHDLVPHAGRRARGVGGSGFPSSELGRASTPSASASASTATTTGPRGATRRCRAGSTRSAGTSRPCPATCSAASRARLRSCGDGCPLGAKQSTLRTWLEDAAGAGARIVVGAKARAARRDRLRCRRRCRAGRRCGPRRRRGSGRDRDPGAAAPLRPRERERRPRPSPASGAGGLRVLRRGDPALGRDDAGDLLG